MKDHKINILGKEWHVKFLHESDDPDLIEHAGYTDTSVRTIVICIPPKGPMSLENLKNFTSETLRHEIVHAVLYESGLRFNSSWAENEECVDWIAIQFPKLLEIFKKEGIDK